MVIQFKRWAWSKGPATYCTHTVCPLNTHKQVWAQIGSWPELRWANKSNFSARRSRQNQWIHQVNQYIRGQSKGVLHFDGKHWNVFTWKQEVRQSNWKPTLVKKGYIRYVMMRIKNEGIKAERCKACCHFTEGLESTVNADGASSHMFNLSWDIFIEAGLVLGQHL